MEEEIKVFTIRNVEYVLYSDHQRFVKTASQEGYKEGYEEGYQDGDVLDVNENS